jgi:hypothetical protein
MHREKLYRRKPLLGMADENEAPSYGKVKKSIEVRENNG